MSGNKRYYGVEDSESTHDAQGKVDTKWRTHWCVAWQYRRYLSTGWFSRSKVYTIIVFGYSSHISHLVHDQVHRPGNTVRTGQQYAYWIRCHLAGYDKRHPKATQEIVCQEWARVELVMPDMRLQSRQ